MQARSHVKKISHLNCPDFVTPIIHNALNPLRQNVIPIWGKAEFIGCCILLRGCAKTLMDQIPVEEREKMVTAWTEGLAWFLQHDPCQTAGGFLVLKIHAAVRDSSVSLTSNDC